MDHLLFIVYPIEVWERLRQSNHLKIGKIGEEIAVNIVKDMGYMVLDKNYRCSLGEIDIVAIDDDVLVFIEVKTRRHSIAYAKESISKRKMRKLMSLASFYIKQKGYYNKKVRFDVLAIYLKDKDIQFELIKDAFCYES